MNRSEFMQILEESLEPLSSQEVYDILYDYEEHFNIGLSKGKTEWEIAKELGNPRDIAKSYIDSSNIHEPPKNTSHKGTLKTILTAIALVLFNMFIVLTPFIAIISILLALYSTSIATIIGGVNLPRTIYLGFHPLTSISFGIGLIALGILMLIGCFYLTRFLYRGVLKYIRWNIDLIKE